MPISFPDECYDPFCTVFSLRWFSSCRNVGISWEPKQIRKARCFSHFSSFSSFSTHSTAGNFRQRAFSGISERSHLMLSVFALTFALQVVITQWGGAFFNTTPLPMILWLRILATGFTIRISIVVENCLKLYSANVLEIRKNAPAFFSGQGLRPCRDPAARRWSCKARNPFSFCERRKPL